MNVLKLVGNRCWRGRTHGAGEHHVVLVREALWMQGGKAEAPTMFRNGYGLAVAALGICKLMGQWSRGKCASGWVSLRKGKRCKETRKWSKTLKYLCAAAHVGQLYAGGGGGGRKLASPRKSGKRRHISRKG